jgi:hypothetical protein
MHCANIHRTDTSGSSTKCLMLGMMYSRKMAALEGVMTVTIINYNKTIINLTTFHVNEPHTVCIRVRMAAALTTAASSCNRSTIYGTIRSNFASSVRCMANERSTSNARTLEVGWTQLRILEVTRARTINAGPSSLHTSVKMEWENAQERCLLRPPEVQFEKVPSSLNHDLGYSAQQGRRPSKPITSVHFSNSVQGTYLEWSEITHAIDAFYLDPSYSCFSIYVLCQ